MSQSPGPGWWLASDGKWYPPHLHPDVRHAAPADAQRRTAEPHMTDRSTAPTPGDANDSSTTTPAAGAGAPVDPGPPMGDPNAPLPHRRPAPGGAAATPPTTAAPEPAQTLGASVPPVEAPAPTTPSGPTAPADPTPPAVTTPAPLAASTPPVEVPTEPAPPVDNPPTTDEPVVRWSNDQQRQPVAANPEARAASAPNGRPDDPGRLIPLPDLDDEPATTSSAKATNKAPTLADTLLGARANTPEAALPETDTSAERWVRPTSDVPAPATPESGADVLPTTAILTPPTNTTAATPTARDEVVAPAHDEPEVDDHTDDTDTKTRSDRLVNVGVIVLAGALALGAGYFLLRGDDGGDEASSDRPVDELSVGDCFGGELAGNAEVENVPIVDCSLPHQYEVFHATDFDPADAPFDPQAIRRQATRSCLEQLESIIGVPAAEAPVELLLLNPTERSWSDDDDRTSLCLAYDPNGPLRAPLG